MSAERSPESSDDNIPLCVDLDGTLIKTDSLFEALILMLKEQPLRALLLPLWLLKGKAHFKQCLADRIALSPELLPYDESFLSYLREQKMAGRRLVLATAANNKFACQVADHLGLFSEVIASDATTNVSGALKLQKLEESFGHGQFDYAGNSLVDLPIWEHAREAILVNPSRGVERAIGPSVTIRARFGPEGRKLQKYAEAIRVHQWLKNLLVFVPLAASHRIELLTIRPSESRFSCFLLLRVKRLPAKRYARSVIRPGSLEETSAPVGGGGCSLVSRYDSHRHLAWSRVRPRPCVTY